jgi:hypothetical protein
VGKARESKFEGGESEHNLLPEEQNIRQLYSLTQEQQFEFDRCDVHVAGKYCSFGVEEVV